VYTTAIEITVNPRSFTQSLQGPVSYFISLLEREREGERERETSICQSYPNDAWSVHAVCPKALRPFASGGSQAKAAFEQGIVHDESCGDPGGAGELL